jgi:hypothetical protein
LVDDLRVGTVSGEQPALAIITSLDDERANAAGGEILARDELGARLALAHDEAGARDHQRGLAEPADIPELQVSRVTPNLIVTHCRLQSPE